MKKLIGALFTVLLTAVSVASDGRTYSFINSEVPDFLGTVMVEVDGKPVWFGSGFVRQSGVKQEFVTAKHVVTLEDEDILSAKLRIFLKSGVIEIPSLLGAVEKTHTTDIALIALPAGRDVPAARLSKTLPAIEETVTIYGTGTTSSDFRGISRGYYSHKPRVELWQYKVKARVTAKDVPGCEISVDLCKDFLRALFWSDGPETKYLAIKPQMKIPDGFSGGPAVNKKGEIVGVYIGGFKDANTDILTPLIIALKGGQ